METDDINISGEAMLSRETLVSLMDAWVSRGWLRALDLAFMRFLDELDPPSEPLFLLAAALASHQLGLGHVCLDLAATLDAPDETLSLPPEGERHDASSLLPSRVLARHSLAGWRRRVAASPLVATGEGNTPLVLSGNRLYLRRYWRYEQQVAQAIHERLQQPSPVPADLQQRLAALFPHQADSDGPDWQKIACALAVRGAFTVITGGPGTGKTTTVAKLLAMLQSSARQQGEKLRIHLAAPTGKAAARLTESIAKALGQLPEDMREGVPTEAGTLHRLLGARVGTRHFKHHADNPLHADLVVIDEASMIDLEMMASLLDALHPDTRLVLLGDKDQLASVEAGAVLGDLCRDAAKNAYTPATAVWIAEVCGDSVAAFESGHGPLSQQIALLRTSHRFGANSGIGRLADAVNTGDTDAACAIWQRPFPDIAKIDLRDENDRRLERFALDGGNFATPEPAQGYRHYLDVIQRQRPQPGAGGEAYEQWGKAVLAAFDQFQLLCVLRRGPWGVEGLNRRIADTLFQAGLIGQTWGWYEGRPVLMTRNDYSLGLMNGDIGITLRLPDASGPDALRVVFPQPDHRLKQVLPSRLTDIETVYAMTVHKSQGSEFAHVGLVLPDRPNPILTRELVYTGITRARQWFSLLAPDAQLFAQATARRVRRLGGLADCLAGKGEEKERTALLERVAD